MEILKLSSLSVHTIKYVVNKSPPDIWLALEGAFFMACFSNLPMNRLAYEGAIRVPTMVP